MNKYDLSQHQGLIWSLKINQNNSQDLGEKSKIISLGLEILNVKILPIFVLKIKRLGVKGYFHKLKKLHLWKIYK